MKPDNRSRPWPWFGHRTLAEVARTEALLAKADSRSGKMTAAECSEFGYLIKKARRHNPPPEAGIPDRVA